LTKMDGPPRSLFGGLLLKGAYSRLAAAGTAVLCLWIAVLWASLSEPSRKTAEPAVSQATNTMRLVVASGQAAPGGGRFNRFDVSSQPIVAPVNGRGQVAFYASVARAKAAEGIFLATAAGISKAAAVGDAVQGGGMLAEFARHPLPALNDAGKVAFGASVVKASASEGIFLASEGRLKAIALSGADAPGVRNGTFVEFDAPVLNNRDEIAFVGTVRQGRETLQVLYLYSGGVLRKLVGGGDPAPRGGTFDRFGLPAVNNKGTVVFPAVIEHGAVLGGIFTVGASELRLVVGAGQIGPGGEMLVRFSERAAIDDDDNVAFIAHLGSGTASEALLVADASGLTQLAATGEPAPGGGRFSAFGPWPNFGRSATVAFVAAVDDGPGPLGIYIGSAGAIRRIAMVGDRLTNGGVLPPLALNSVTSAGSNGGLTFATVTNPEDGQNGIYYYGPPGS
jgi:hypothetical protein